MSDLDSLNSELDSDEEEVVPLDELDEEVDSDEAPAGGTVVGAGDCKRGRGGYMPKEAARGKGGKGGGGDRAGDPFITSVPTQLEEEEGDKDDEYAFDFEAPESARQRVRFGQPPEFRAFVNATRAEVAAENPGLSYRELAELVTKKWRCVVVRVPVVHCGIPVTSHHIGRGCCCPSGL